LNNENDGQASDHELHLLYQDSAVIMIGARTNHLTEKSNLPYKPESSRGGSRASQGRTSRIRGLSAWIYPAFNG